MARRWSGAVAVVLLFIVAPHGAHAADVAPFVGASFGAPGAFAVGGGLALGGSVSSNVHGVVELEAGTGGGKLAVGLVFLLIPDSWGMTIPHTISLRPVVQRTWNSPRGVPPGKTLFGAEIEYALAFLVKVHVGLLVYEGRSFTSWGLGVRIPLGSK